MVESRNLNTMEKLGQNSKSTSIGSIRPSIQQHDVGADVTLNRKQKPASAYKFYQKLVQDFDSLEREMESHQEQQKQLEAQLERAKAKIQASKAQDQQAQKLQWERERDNQLEIFVQQRTTIDNLRAQTEELEAQELRLQAEMEVLHEKQQEASETEARRIRRLVHERTTLLEDELAKGKLDLDYITQVVSSAHRQELKQNQPDNHENTALSVNNLVQDVQERRRRDFEVAESNFLNRMRSFQLEKDELAKKAKELQVTKKRALQILSQNQQLAIKSFFDTPLTEEKRSSSPSLDFGEILQSLNQSGSQVKQIQAVGSERNSGRRNFADALQQARANLERGSKRIEEIQKNLESRKIEAQKLGVSISGAIATGYDGKWGIESYSPRQYETVYFVRTLVFSWINTAVAEVNAAPDKELLEFEVKRWSATHRSVEYDRDRERNFSLAGYILDNLMREVIIEIAADIRSEFEWNCHRVRDTITTAIKNVLFPNEKFVPPQAKETPAKSQGPLWALRSSLFEFSFDHMRTLRNRRNNSSSIAHVHQTTLPVSRRQAATTKPPPPTTKSPAKKMFGLFKISRGSAALEVKKETLEQPQVVMSKPDAEIIPFIPSDRPTSPPDTFTTTFWQNPQLRLRTITMPSSHGHSSCLQISSTGDLLICGTVDGELILWDLLPDQPLIIRMWSPPKAERSRIIRVVLSPDSQLVIAFFRRKTIGVFAINPTNTTSQAKPKQATHSEDRFPVDPKKYKPRIFELLMQISAADALAELTFTSALHDRAPNAVSKNPVASSSAAELTCGSFFASFSHTGIMKATSILFGASTGDLLKINLNPQREDEAQWDVIQAAFDSPGPTDTNSLSTKPIRREFFRGHRRAVFFASCIHRQSSELQPTEILSVDQDGIVCIWEYKAAKFAGFGWFEPTVKLQMELGLDQIQGEMLQVALTPDHTRLVSMVFYADPTKKEVAGTLRFLQILTSSMRLDRVQMSTNFVGGNGAPRFALTKNFLLLLANNVVRVFTLRTGKEAQQSIVLSPPGQQQLVFNNITCITSVTHNKPDSPMKTSRGRPVPTTITFVVSGDQHSRLLVHSFTASSSLSSNNIKHLH
ncbi:hypothetical protein L915_09626 [Phytophthora nicotianae]|uniref:Uncharacterized protein n=1 Tax=Phytophthora nicotianae TaxID=4792 RepID=W2GRK3_PHYNI|nr:hypothetical protein L915_09626 [Phytophthora nicotianae]